jgi:hypothetical protein
MISKTRQIRLGRVAEAGRGSPSELKSFLSAEIRRYGELVRATGMKAD